MVAPSSPSVGWDVNDLPPGPRSHWGSRSTDRSVRQGRGFSSLRERPVKASRERRISPESATHRDVALRSLGPAGRRPDARGAPLGRRSPGSSPPRSPGRRRSPEARCRPGGASARLLGRPAQAPSFRAVRRPSRGRDSLSSQSCSRAVPSAAMSGGGRVSNPPAPGSAGRRFEGRRMPSIESGPSWRVGVSAGRTAVGSWSVLSYACFGVHSLGV